MFCLVDKKNNNIKNKCNKILLAFVIFISIFSAMGNLYSIKANALGNTNVEYSGGKLVVKGEDFNYSNNDSAWNAFFGKYRSFVVGFSGLATITLIGVFIMNFMKLAMGSCNPNERARVQQGLIWSAIAAAGTGGVTILVGFFYNFL